ncbi:MAG: hypothetical protein KH138_07175 [Firmicutes bacterium]|nr:hypothetical protein [Bacillota bacterium]
MDTWNAKYSNKWNEFEVKFCSDDYEKAKAVERVCQYIMDGEITSRSDVAPVRIGFWIPIPESAITGWNPAFAGCDPIAGYRCSRCGNEAIFSCNDVFVLSDYCPNCGAKMEETK